MKRLIAVVPILFKNHSYKQGDELPMDNAEFVEAWTKNRAAIWQEENEKLEKVAKAKPAAAPTGLCGDAYPSAGLEQNLVGRPPSKKARGAQPEPTKGRRKSSA